MTDKQTDKQTDTIFGRIIDGTIPCHRIHENEHVLAFLDVGPLSRGHTLLIPKERVANLHDLSDDAAAAVGRILPSLCRAIIEATGATSYNILQNNGPTAGQEVMHVHFHIIPGYKEPGLKKHWTPSNLDHEEAATLAQTIANHLT